MEVHTTSLSDDMRVALSGLRIEEDSVSQKVRVDHSGLEAAIGAAVPLQPDVKQLRPRKE